MYTLKLDKDESNAIDFHGYRYAVSEFIQKNAHCDDGSECYIMAMNCDMQKYDLIETILITAKLATRTSETITLTDTGKIMAERCNAAVGIKTKSA